jgi:SAM-dependent methyltransferase
MSVLERLAREGNLLCPRTGAPLEVRDGRIVSREGEDHGAQQGPVNLVIPSAQKLDPAWISDEDVRRVRAHLELPDTPEMAAGVREALAATGLVLGDAHLSAEVRLLAERFNIPQFDFARHFESGEGRLARWAGRARDVFRPRDEAYVLEPLSESIGDALTAGHEIYRSVRVRQAGHRALHRPGEKHPAAIVATWKAQDGTVATDATLETPLPVTLEPGREITLQVRLRAPAKAGTYTLQLALRIDGKEALAPFLEKPVRSILCELPVFEYEYFEPMLEYEADHRVALEELARFFAARPGPRRLLEIGGGVHPTGQGLAWEGHEVVSCDVSPAMCMLGHLFFRARYPELDERLGFLACDAARLPFADASFDGVVLFAAFHHFADPIGLLREAKRVVRGDGFVYIACDGCVPQPSDPIYVQELERGINEQVFTLSEYRGFFRATGWRVARARVDSHSLKAILVRDA